MTKKEKRKKQQKRNAAKSASANEKASQNSKEFQANAGKSETRAEDDVLAIDNSSKSADASENFGTQAVDVEEIKQPILKDQHADSHFSCRSPSKKRKQQDKIPLKNEKLLESDDEFQERIEYDQSIQDIKPEPRRSSSRRSGPELEIKCVFENMPAGKSTYKKETRISMKCQSTGKVQESYLLSGRPNANGENVNRKGRKGNLNKYENTSRVSTQICNDQSCRSCKQKYKDPCAATLIWESQASAENASGEWEVANVEDESPSKATSNAVQTPKDVKNFLKENIEAQGRENEEFQEFNQKWKTMSFKKITEKNTDLFRMSEDYSLGHCVTADLEMEAGIALQFRQTFCGIEELRSQNQGPGGLAVLQVGPRFIYYLVTKSISRSEPTNLFMWKSLQKLKQHIIINEVKKLALPRIGCGQDSMNWSYVKIMLEYIFQKVDIELCVCSIKNKHHKNSSKKQSTLENFGVKLQNEAATSICEKNAQSNVGKNENYIKTKSSNDTKDYRKMNDRSEKSMAGASGVGRPSQLNKNEDLTENVNPNIVQQNLQSASNSRVAETIDRKRSMSKPKHNTEYESRDKIYSENKTRDRNRSSSRQRNDAEFDKFERIMRSNSDFNYIKVKEIEADLFIMSKEYAIGHCVAEDMNMGSGIAVQFRQKFKQVDKLLDQRQRQGGLAVLNLEGRYVYYLVTKRTSSGKPTYLTFWTSLQKMKKHVSENKVKKIALPRIGCGLDGLEWLYVKKMLEYVFTNVDVEITICNYQQDSDSPLPVAQKQKKKCKVVNYPEAIVELEEWSIIIYLGSEDGYITDNIKSLDAKFSIESAYKRGIRKVGQTIRTDKEKYILYGFIVKKRKDDSFGFANFQKCLNFVEKSNAKDLYEYVGIQAFKDFNDNFIMSKLVNLMRNTLTCVDIYICWPPELQNYMPKNA